MPGFSDILRMGLVGQPSSSQVQNANKARGELKATTGAFAPELSAWKNSALTPEQYAVAEKFKMPTQIPPTEATNLMSLNQAMGAAASQQNDFDPAYAGFGLDTLGDMVQWTGQKYPKLTKAAGEFVESATGSPAIGEKLQKAGRGGDFFDAQTRLLKQVATSLERGKLSDFDFKIMQDTDIGPGDSEEEVRIKSYILHKSALHQLASQIDMLEANGIPSPVIEQAVGKESYQAAKQAGPWNPNASLLNEAITEYERMNSGEGNGGE